MSLPKDTKRVNPFAAGLEEWEQPLGQRPPARGAAVTKGAVRVRGKALVSAAPPAEGGGDRFRKGLEEWEHPLGERR